MYWTSSSGKIELNITKKIAAQCSHAGNCDLDVTFWMNEQPIKKQLDKVNHTDMAMELKECGAWDEIELQDNEANKMRLLWIASCDIMEGNN